MAKRSVAMLGLCALLAGCNAKPAGARAQEQLAALQQKRAEAAKAEKVEPLEPLPTNIIKLEAPYDDAQTTVLLPDGPCPDGLWSLFPGDGPGTGEKKLTPAEKKTALARKAELAATFAGKQFLLKLKGSAQVLLQPFDAPAGKFVIEVPGTFDCTDAQGRIAIAWTDTKAVDPSAGSGELAQNVWQAAPMRFELPMRSLSEAKTFYDKNRAALSARVVFGLGKVEVDKKLKRPPKISRDVAGEHLAMGGTDEDWGAGRLIHATLVGARVATDRERTQLFDQRAK